MLPAFNQHIPVPMFNPSTYRRTASISSFMVSSSSCFGARNMNGERQTNRHAVPSSLRLVEHARECRLEPERFLDFVCAHIGVFAVFQKARTLMLADELDECRSIGLPVRREAFEVFEDGL